MKAVILNWKSGENDPFSVMNATIRQHLQVCGKNVETLEISGNEWPARLVELAHDGVEFAYTWQGLGSSTRLTEDEQSLWDQLRIPLICIHGDHPSHMPRNHSLESRYCFHLYANAEHARYSNRHFRHLRGASVIDIPQLHREPRLTTISGDHFVLAKNIDHPLDMEAVWRERLDRLTFEAYMAAAEDLKSNIASPGYVEIHNLLDNFIADRAVAWDGQELGSPAYHQFHSQLDRYARSYRSVRAVTLMRDFPLRIHGRGWERVASTAPISHTFQPGRDMADSQEMLYSRFGILDVSPSKGLHDRTRRAMANGTGFLSSASLEESFPDLDRFRSLFFSFDDNDLASKCEAVVVDPDAHRALAKEFGRTYHIRFHFKRFVAAIDSLAKSASAL